MLMLKRIQYFNEWIKCHVSGDIMTHGDYYYEDNDDGFIVKALVYKEIKEQAKAEKFDYSKLEKAASEREYRQMLKQYENEFKASTILDRKIYDGRDVK